MDNLGCTLTSETNTTEQKIIKLTSWVDSAGILHHCTFIFVCRWETCGGMLTTPACPSAAMTKVFRLSLRSVLWKNVRRY